MFNNVETFNVLSSISRSHAEEKCSRAPGAII